VATNKSRSMAPKKRPNARADARKAAQRQQRIILIVVGVAVVGLAVVIGLLTARDSGERADIPSMDDVAGEVEVTGEGFPRHEAEGDDPAVGQSSPEVAGEDFDGTAVEIGGDGRPQLVTFAASWCPACQEELPSLTAWLNDGNLPDEVDLIMVSTNHDRGRGNWPPQDWYDEVGYPGPILVDDASASVAEAYGLSGTPFWVAIDADGSLVWRGSGMISMTELSDLADQLADTPSS